MARKPGEAQIVELNEADLEYAQMLLSWSRSLDEEVTLLENYEQKYWEEGEVRSEIV